MSSALVPIVKIENLKELNGFQWTLENITDLDKSEAITKLH
jgi:hypothetical protein